MFIWDGLGGVDGDYGGIQAPTTVPIETGNRSIFLYNRKRRFGGSCGSPQDGGAKRGEQEREGSVMTEGGVYITAREVLWVHEGSRRLLSE